MYKLDGKIHCIMVETFDGVYKTRTGNHGERLIQMPVIAQTWYKRYFNEESGEIRMVPVRE